MGYTEHMLNHRPALTVPTDSKIVAVMQKAWEEVIGKPAELFYCSGGTDAAYIVEKYGFPMVVCGPTDGLSNTGHANECIRIEQLLQMVTLYALTVVRLLS